MSAEDPARGPSNMVLAATPIKSDAASRKVAAVVVGGLVLFLAAIGAMVAGRNGTTHSSTDQAALPTAVLNLSDQSSHTRFDNGLQIEAARTYWVMETRYGSMLCIPAVSFLLRNTGTAPIESYTYRAQFLDPTAHRVFSEAVAYESEQPGTLPPGYTRGIVLHADKGFEPATGRCSPDSLAQIKFEIAATMETYRDKALIASGYMQTSEILVHADGQDWEDIAEEAANQTAKGLNATPSH